MEMTTENYFEDTDVLASIMVQTPEQFHGHNQLNLYPQALSEVLCVHQPRGRHHKVQGVPDGHLRHDLSHDHHDPEHLSHFCPGSTTLVSMRTSGKVYYRTVVNYKNSCKEAFTVNDVMTFSREINQHHKNNFTKRSLYHHL